MTKDLSMSGFHAVLNAQRITKGLTWKQVTEQTGISRPTLHRIKHGGTMSFGTLMALLAWSGLDAAHFRPGAEPMEPLAQAIAILRSDPTLSQADAEKVGAILTVTYEQLRKLGQLELEPTSDLDTEGMWQQIPNESGGANWHPR